MFTNKKTNSATSYSEAIHSGFEYLLQEYPEFFIIGQGLWSPWYVGNTMLDLDKKFGKERIIDSPVSELACTGAAIGASLVGSKPLVVHPRVDFLILAADQVVNQAAKWSYMLGGKAKSNVTIRAIINRGGEQGAQHSQALHSWFAHIPGLVVAMPSSVNDARDLLIASVLCDSPVLYIDDRWLYSREEIISPIKEINLMEQKPKLIREGNNLSLVGIGYTSYLCEQSALILSEKGIECDVIDLRLLNPLNVDSIVESVKKTGNLLVIDGAWRTAGMAGEIIASVMQLLDLSYLRQSPRRITLPDCPAPTSRSLESVYYPTCETLVENAIEMVGLNDLVSK